MIVLIMLFTDINTVCHVDNQRDILDYVHINDIYAMHAITYNYIENTSQLDDVDDIDIGNSTVAY